MEGKLKPSGWVGVVWWAMTLSPRGARRPPHLGAAPSRAPAAEPSRNTRGWRRWRRRFCPDLPARPGAPA
eukprot:9487935-Pyramimonas_sp.AAC.1